MLADRISDAFQLVGQTVKSLIKIAVQSRLTARPSADITNLREPLIILGNGPSLTKSLDEDMDILISHDLLAVNFAANTDVFFDLKPRYYLLMDPHFFRVPSPDPNVGRLFDRLVSQVDWPMTLFIPSSINLGKSPITDNKNITVRRFNPVGVEGPKWFERVAYNSRLGMPRPRNVLIPAIMVGIWLGYKDIALLGADHSWLRTLDVDENNVVISIQPHFYADGEEEHRRVATMFRNTHLHELLWGFQLAFRGYHRISRYLHGSDITVTNCTPGSYIDAFPRRGLRELCCQKASAQ